MKDNAFTDSNKNVIPTLDLLHQSQKVDFAYRTLEFIHDRTGGKPDVPHRHNYYTVLWVKQATGTHLIDYKEYPLVGCRVFFVSPGQVHQVMATSRPSGAAILFTNDFLAKNHICSDFIDNLGLFSDMPDTPPITTHAGADANLQLITSQMEAVFGSDQRFKADAIGALLKLFLIECNKLVDSIVRENTQALHAGRTILSDFKRLVEEKLQQWHKVSDYAAHLSISPDYLNNVIKSNIGTTAKDYIQNRIVIEAKRMGVVTEMSSKEIAYSLGFDDPAHFSKFFKNATGTVFSDFRAELPHEIGA